MANLANKDCVYLARFRYRGREYKKSLKTRDTAAAKAVIKIVELTIHRLLTGQLQIPADVDPADFIVSGGTRTHPCEAAEPPPAAPSMRAAVAGYLASRENKDTIGEYTTSGGVVNASLISGLSSPLGIALDGQGHIFVANNLSGTSANTRRPAKS